MSFNPLAGWTVASLIPHLAENPTVIELGNQSFTVSDEILRKIINKADSDMVLGNQIDRPAIQNLIGMKPEDKQPLTEAFYKMLGFSNYAAIDTNSNLGSLMMDLNLDLRSHYKFQETYDLITNIGTSEHIFNQYAVFKNVHDMTNVNGLMLHIMPFVNWVNHGFYNYHPVLYADLAAANDYVVVRLALANGWGREVVIDLADKPVASKSKPPSNPKRPAPPPSLLRRIARRLGARRVAVALGLPRPRPVSRIKVDLNGPPPHVGLREALLSIKPKYRDVPLGLAIRWLYSEDIPNIMVVAALKKRKDTGFVMPMQGRYVTDIESTEISKRYGVQSE
jgi:hypothetical protein